MRASAIGLGLLLVGCQMYDFEPVTPLAVAQTVKRVTVGVRPPKPALFLVVDKSGSMDTAIAGGGTRMDAMKAAMGTFLTQSGASAHLGMLPFPSATTACAGGDIANVTVPLDQGNEDDARLAQSALVVKAEIDALRAGGGTPTAATMHGIATYPPMLERDRDRFALLLTDGLPNCNSANDPQLQTCTCTLPAPRPASCSAMSVGVTYNQCLDDQGSAAEIDLLKTKGIRTIVIGFGTDVANPDGAAAMARMAAAGGFTRPCTQSSDCNAGDTCSAGGIDPCGRAASTCGQSFFQAGNASELGRVLDAIRESVRCPVCQQVLTRSPSDPSYISVLIDGVPTQPGPDTWEFRPSATAPGIQFLGAMCQQLENSSVADPIQIEIRSVEQL